MKKELTRAQVGAFIESVRRELGGWKRGDNMADTTINSILFALNNLGLEPLEPCTGEAHSNSFIDNCGCCAPRWGWTGNTIKIK